ncbi:MAG: mannose-6-phosphate isomerase, class I [Salinibacterium sp.]|nr:MAG: mannose-6-phosphate isomerase, class I [Salinibacterium sp.]
MFVRLTNTPRDYAWGSEGAISSLLGLEPTGRPEAELWLGAHHGSPSRILDPAQTGGHKTLDEWIAADAATALRSGARLPFLLKILSAAAPLSLQAHPSAEQAAEGFAREDAAGIPIDAANRNYKDPFPKPELIYALSETFEALCGFRPASEIRATIDRLIELQTSAPVRDWRDRLVDDAALRPVFEWLISRGGGVPELIERVVSIARSNPAEFPTIVDLAEAYPGDPGIVISLMLNHVQLRRGEALYLPAGNIHAYLDGLGVELMTASDNVLRGGLTPKHVDVPELLSVLDFTPSGVSYLAPESPSPGVEVFAPDANFRLARIEDEGMLALSGPAIVVCTEGDLVVTGGRSTASVSRGDCVYVTPDEASLSVAGHGTVFVATTR